MKISLLNIINQLVIVFFCCYNIQALQENQQLSVASLGMREIMKESFEPTLIQTSNLVQLIEEDRDITQKTKNLVLYGFSSNNLEDLLLFTNLNSLDLSRICKKNYAFMQNLTSLTMLKTLYLGSNACDDGLKYITNLPLTILDLSGANLIGNGLKYVGQLTQLTSLDISKTLVNDRMLMELTNLINLEKFNLESTRVTQNQVEKLKIEISRKRKELGLKELDFDWKT